MSWSRAETADLMVFVHLFKQTCHTVLLQPEHLRYLTARKRSVLPQCLSDAKLVVFVGTFTAEPGLDKKAQRIAFPRLTDPHGLRCRAVLKGFGNPPHSIRVDSLQATRGLERSEQSPGGEVRPGPTTERWRLRRGLHVVVD